MKHMPTWDLLDLADDMKSLVREFSTRKWSERYVSAVEKLSRIDIELLSRMPEGEFITMYGWVDKGIVLEPVGFEPAYYSKLDEAQAELDEAESRLDESSYYFYRD